MFEIELQPALQEAVRGLKAATAEETEKVLRDLAAIAPEELKNMLGYGDPSKRGEPPTNDTFELYRSIEAERTGRGEVTVTLAEHAKYLDPVFGGYLERPFIEKGLENAVKRLQVA